MIVLPALSFGDRTIEDECVKDIRHGQFRAAYRSTVPCGLTFELSGGLDRTRVRSAAAVVDFGRNRFDLDKPSRINQLRHAHRRRGWPMGNEVLQPGVPYRLVHRARQP
jgi:hypothetical protein